MIKKVILTTSLFLVVSFGYSQSKEELQAQKAEKQAEADAAQGEANAIQAQIDALPGWKKGAFGVIGGSLSNFNNWYAQGVPNNSSGNIGINFNAYANKLEAEYFWRNSLTVNLAWVKLDDKDDPTDNKNFQGTTKELARRFLVYGTLAEIFARETGAGMGFEVHESHAYLGAVGSDAGTTPRQSSNGTQTSTSTPNDDDPKPPRLKIVK